MFEQHSIFLKIVLFLDAKEAEQEASLGCRVRSQYV